MTKLEQIGLAIFEKVTGDRNEPWPDADEQDRWEALSNEEQEDAREWARAAMTEARSIDGRMETAIDIEMPRLIGGRAIWQAGIDAILTKWTEGDGLTRERI